MLLQSEVRNIKDNYSTMHVEDITTNTEATCNQSRNKRRQKYRHEGVKGKAAIRPDDKFKPAEIKLSLFLSNVHKDA